MNSIKLLIKASLILILHVQTFNLFSQSDNWKEGYIVTQNNDTIKGQIKWKNGAPTYMVKLMSASGEIKKYPAKKFEKMVVDGRKFESHIFLNRNYYIFELYFEGPISLYTLEKHRYIKKQDQEIQMIESDEIRKILLSLVKDNPKVFNMVWDNPDFTEDDIFNIVKEYNSQAMEASKSKENYSDIPDHQDILMMKIDSVLDQNLFNFRINFAGVGLGLETKISNSISLYIESGSGIQAYFSTEGNDFILNPYVKFQPRFFTDLKSRALRGQNVQHFSGTYIGLTTVIVAFDDATLLLGPSFGFQHQRRNHFYWGLEAGVAYSKNLTNETSTLIPLIGGSLGINF